MNLIKKHIAVSLILLLFGSFFLQNFILVDFLLHQKEITKKHCENKDKPLLKCNGKCHLSKQLKLIENKLDQENSNYSIKLNIIWLNAFQPLVTKTPNLLKEEFIHNAYYWCCLTKKVSQTIFHPPELLV